MSYKEIIELLKKQDFVTELKENKKRTRGNISSFYSSNIRTNKSLVTSFKNIITAISNPNETWKQKSGQDKFKHQKKVFTSDHLQLFTVSEENVWSLTSSGEEYKKMIDAGNEEEFVSKVMEQILDLREMEDISNNISAIFTDDQIDYSIKRLKETKVMLHDDYFKKLIVKLTFAKTHEFTDDITGSEMIELFDELRDLDILTKYEGGGSVQFNTLASILELVKGYKEGKVTPRSPKQISRKVSVTSTKISRDQGEVAKALRRSGGICEICKNIDRQFIKEDGNLYSEVHHIVPLGVLDTDEEIEKYDKVLYLITLCPFHHKEFHHSKDRAIFGKIIEAAKGWGMTEKIEDKK